MKFLFIVMVMFAAAWTCVRMEFDAGPSFNVIDYGANGNGQTDDSQSTKPTQTLDFLYSFCVALIVLGYVTTKTT
ncbi:hypothetical protein Fmac_011350 [Flemingia macrophylla]|uniref:Uncharacterized protein n=1 Tax=Flemingia macrophylla TaxID=520843 RepID=A0ABD1MM90_9FABA